MGAAFHNHCGIKQKLSDLSQAFCQAIFKKKIESSVILPCSWSLAIIDAGYFFTPSVSSFDQIPQSLKT